jgi:hypothetical protein
LICWDKQVHTQQNKDAMMLMLSYKLVFQSPHDDWVVICFRTRAVQKLIETVSTRKQIVLIISALQPSFMHLVNDLNGNHVIQKCLTHFGAEENKVHIV